MGREFKVVHEKIFVFEPWRHRGTYSLFSILNLLFPILLFYLTPYVFSQWTATTGNMGSVYSIVESPWGDLYAGTNNDAFRLEDGVGWIRVDSGFPEEGVVVWDLAVKAEYLFAATDSGVYRHSGGDGWVATMDTNLTFGRLVVKDSALFAGVWWNFSKSIPLNGGGVYRSYDNGNTWILAYNEEDTLWTRNFAVMGSSLFMTEDGDVYRSDDDGETWRIPHDDSVFEYSRGSLGIMGSRLYAGGGGGRIYRSDDSGSTWDRIDASLPSSTFLVHEQTLFVGGGAGSVFFSLDSGDTWHEWSEGIRDEDRNRHINSLLIHDGYLLAGTGYQFCGPNSCDPPQGRIWQRPLSEVVSISDGPVAHGPTAKLKVIQGSGSEIKFTLQQDGWVELGLYTTGGKLAATLVQREYEVGAHHVSLSERNLPGGLYLARLKAPGVNQAQKILLEN